MSIVNSTTIGGGLITQDRKYNRRFFSKELANVTKKRTLYRRNELKNLPSFSLLGQINDLWSAFTTDEKNAWQAAGNVCELEGRNLFIQDQSYRITNDIAGVATPNLFHQYKIGHLFIPENSGNVLLRQVGNSLSTYGLQLKISYKTIIEADIAGGDYLKIRLKYKYFSGGSELEQTNEYSLDYLSDWQNSVFNPTQHSGETGYFELEIEANNIHGHFYFDNFFGFASGVYFTRDKSCEQVEKVYQPLGFPEGVNFISEYPDDSI